MLRNIYGKVRLFPAFVVAMSDQICNKHLKRKLDDSSEMATHPPLSYANAVARGTGTPAQSGSSSGKSSCQTNYSHQGPTPTKNDRKNEPPHTSSDQRNSNRSGDSRGRGHGKQGSKYHDNSTRQSNNQAWNRGDSKDKNRGGKGGRGGRNESDRTSWSSGRNYESNQTSHVNSDNRNQDYGPMDFEDYSTGFKPQGPPTAHHQTSATKATQRHRQDSQSKDNSASSKKAPQPAVISQSHWDSSTNPPSSESPTKSPPSESPTRSHSLSDSERMYNQTSNLISESSPPSDLARKSLPETPMKSLSLLDPATQVNIETKERDSQRINKSAEVSGSGAGSGADSGSGADRREKCSDSKNTAQRNDGPAQRNDGPAQRNDGPAQRNDGPAQRNDGRAQRNDGPAQRNDGRAQRNDGPAQRNDGPAQRNDVKEPKSQESGKGFWKGVPITQLRRAPECFKEYTSVQAAEEMPTNEEAESQESRVNKHVPVSSYVQLPHQMQQASGRNYRWENIERILRTKIATYWDLERVLAAIAEPHSQYNPHEKADFGALKDYFKTLTEQEVHHLIHTTLPKIQMLALELPALFQDRLPILKQRFNQEITLTQLQAACLLANAFFSTFAKRIHKFDEGKPLQMPEFNFINLYGHMKSHRKIEKLKCIFNYFQRVTDNIPDGSVTYKRVYCPLKKNWMTMENKLTDLHVSTEGTIEDERGFLQADFANKFVGGGVLNTGLVQEEIRFVLCPEMIVSRLLTEMLTSDEVLVMIGCERFNAYTGYSDSFKFAGNYCDNTERDELGRKYTEVVAMDASVFRNDFYEQFHAHHVTRELDKAHCAFEGTGARNQSAVCTGNWGCGAFGGDKQLKALIQLMAASVANRDICYLTFGDSELCLQIGHIYEILKARDMSIKDIMKILTVYGNSTSGDSVFKYMEEFITGNVKSTPQIPGQHAGNVKSHPQIPGQSMGNVKSQPQMHGQSAGNVKNQQQMHGQSAGNVKNQQQIPGHDSTSHAQNKPSKKHKKHQ